MKLNINFFGYDKSSFSISFENESDYIDFMRDGFLDAINLDDLNYIVTPYEITTKSDKSDTTSAVGYSVGLSATRSIFSVNLIQLESDDKARFEIELEKRILDTVKTIFNLESLNQIILKVFEKTEVENENI